MQTDWSINIPFRTQQFLLLAAHQAASTRRREHSASILPYWPVISTGWKTILESNSSIAIAIHFP